MNFGFDSKADSIVPANFARETLNQRFPMKGGSLLIKRRFVRTRELKPGMKIDQSIVDKGSRTLIARGAIMDSYLIESLLKLKIMGVYISEGEDDDEEDESYVTQETLEKIEKLKVADRAKVTLTESVKARVSEGVNYIFQNTGSDGFMDATNSISEELMSAIMENEAVAVDIGALKVCDEYTFKHSVDVATMAMIIGKKYGLSQDEIHDIGVSGLLHDVGKSEIPNEILNKAGPLTDEEFAMMRQHSLFGYRILKDISELSDPIKMGVLQHHEKINGAGYPLGVHGDKIHKFARIIAVADIYDALVTERPYKKAFSQRDAVEILMSMTDELDIDAMKSFLGSIILYPVGSTVTLSNGEKARVVENNPETILRPKVVELRSGKVYDLAEDVHCANIVIE